MDDAQNEMQKRLAEIAKSFVAQLTQRYSQISLNLEAYQQDADSRALAEACRFAHSLAGSAAIFGVPEVSVRAKAVEIALQSLVENGSTDADVDCLMANLQQAVLAATTSTS